MSKAAITVDEIIVSVSGTFKTEHVFSTKQHVLGTMALNAAKSEGFFLGADNSQLTLKKTSFWKSVYEITQENKKIGTATPKGALKRAFDITFDGSGFELKPGGSKLRSWSVRNSQGIVVCEFLPRRSLKRGARIRIMAELPMSLIVLCYLLVIKRWQEESSAS
jgi:hypothetical protein